MLDSNDTLAVKDMISAASPLIKSLVDTFLTPRLTNINKKINNLTPKQYIPTEEHFTEYFHRTYKRLSIINTIVFNNSQLFLKEIYLPLTIQCLNSTNTYLIDAVPVSAIQEYDFILITDTAGMGKSTIMKRIFIDIIDSNYGIPIFIELRRLNKDKTIIQEILEQLNSLEKDFDTNILTEFLNEGGFTILLDGYDEIPLTDRDVVTQDIQNFISKAGNNTFFITSRPENALKSFGNFQEFKIKPLTIPEAFSLLTKFDKNG
jgi:predicted NACHT family NTPase